MPHYIEDSLERPVSELLDVIQQRIMLHTTYFGVRTHKNPLDVWVYQEIIHALKPSVIIEIGNKFGGSTLALAHMLDVLNTGQVIAVDIDHSRLHESVLAHPRITFIESPALDAFAQVQAMLSPRDTVLVIEDSSHTYDHTLAVLRKYSTLVTQDSYLIVEDSICHHGVNVGPSPGPYEAIETFCAETSSFMIERAREDFWVTWNPKGFLKRIS